MKKDNKNKLTFADRARAIQKKYVRAKFDPIEKADMESELEALMQEQEMVRSAMGLNQQEQPMQGFAYGGKMYQNGGKINSWNDYIGGMPNIYDRILNPPVQKAPNDDVSTNAVKEYIGGMPNIYERALYNSQSAITNPTVSSKYSKGLSSTPGNEFLYNSATTTTKTPVVSTKPTQKSSVIKQSLVNEPDVFGNSLQDNGWNNVVDNITNYAYKAPAVPMGQTTNNFITTSEVPVRDNKYTQNLTKELNPANADINKLQRFWDANKQYAPYAISGISNIASNLLLANMAKKNQQRINPVLASPEKMNMEPQAEQLRKDASVSKNIGLRQARDLGLNAGATLANMGAIGSGVDRNLAGALTNLYGQQEQYNTGAANQFALQDQDAVNRANMMNAQFGQQTNRDRMSFFDDAIGTIPGVIKDIRMDKADKEMRDALNAQALNSGGRNYYAKGDLFSKGGLTYEVKEVDANGNPTKTELVKDGSAAEKKYKELLLAPKTTFRRQKFNTKRS